jgi:hypothetical protein
MLSSTLKLLSKTQRYTYHNITKKFTSVEEFLKYNGFKHIHSLQWRTIYAGYDYGDVDFHYYVFPLDVAISGRNPDLNLVELLLKAGADPNFMTKTCSQTVLGGIMINDNYWNDQTVDLIKLLIKYGADVNSRDKSDGDSPLHQSAYSWSNQYAEEIMELLIENGAKLYTKNHARRTPYDNVLHSHGWPQYRNWPLPERILNLLDPKKDSLLEKLKKNFSGKPEE